MQSQVDLERLEAAALQAVACEKNMGVPAELTVAQWALESGWGAHQPGNNCFGIKAYPGCYGVQCLTTYEVVNGITRFVDREFATFASLTDCFSKHATLICEGKLYEQAWQQYKASGNVLALIQCIAPIYSTAPNYASLLMDILAMPEITSAIATARK
ncbi:MAG TPA: glucosaminidase domain-containing protein [Bryobacteraceae bacterium]|jgi:flagellar protein FlgJ|nr:glucosaminidase domain-containing protein [Bryobacteraceae bacterium]